MIHLLNEMAQKKNEELICQTMFFLKEKSAKYSMPKLHDIEYYVKL